MSDEVVELLVAVSDLVMRYGGDQNAAIAHGEYFALSDKLEQFDPFKVVANAWWAIPGGGFRTGRGISLGWLWRCAIARMPPDAIIQSVNKTLAENSYVAKIVRPLLGVTTKTKQKITPNTFVLPHADLRKDRPYEELFYQRFDKIIFPSDTAALVQEITVKPVYTIGDRDVFMEAHNAKSQELDKSSDLI